MFYVQSNGCIVKFIRLVYVLPVVFVLCGVIFLECSFTIQTYLSCDTK